MMDVERFNKMYTDGAKYSEMKNEFNISFSTINVTRVKLGLPKRERSFDRFDVDEKRFRELYDSKNPYHTYEEIAAELGCSTSLIVVLRRRLGLPDREPKPRLVIDEDKFCKMYLDGISHDQLCEEFGICIDTIRRLKKKFNLPSRKKKSSYNESDFIAAYNDGHSNHKLATMFMMERKTVSSKITELGLPSRKHPSVYNEADFRKAHASGMSIVELADKFKISSITVRWHVQDLGLSSRANKKTVVVEPLIDSPEPIRSDEKDKTKESIKTKLTAPVQPTKEPKVQAKPMVATFSMPPKSLREIEKLQLQQNIRKAEAAYKITHKEHCYNALIGQELEDQIVTPFTRS